MLRSAIERMAPWIVVLLAPLAGVVLLRAPLINALPNNDTWFYSGYGWALAHHVEVFGWFYYTDRFTVILPISVAAKLFGPVAGYLILRYALMTATGALLYRCVRRFAVPWIAAASVLLLALDPYYLRLMLWDYTTFITLPCTIAGAAVWYLGDTPRQRLAGAIAAGALIAAAVYANPLSALVIPALGAPELVAAARSRELPLFVARLAAAATGAVIVFVAGYLAYMAYLGSFPVEDMYRATLDFLKSGNQLAAPFQRPVSLWLKTEPRIYGPPLVCFATVVILGRRLLQNTIKARVAQFAVAYTAVVWLYRFAFTSSIVETWWAYGMTASTAAFAMPAILDELAIKRVRWTVAVGIAVLATAVVDLVVRSGGGAATSVYDYVRFHPFVLLAILTSCCALAAGAAFARAPRLRLAALAAFCAIVAGITLTPARYIGTNQTGEFSPYGKTEIEAYDAAYDMTRLIAADDRPQSRLLIWSDGLYGLTAISWVNLPHQEGAIESPEQPPTPTSQPSPSNIELLLYPTTRRVLVLSQDAAELAGALPTVRRLGLQPHVERVGTWVGGALHYSLVGLHGTR